ncbi:MAG: segregation/condensation protein A [Bdellovibrionota bacterium]|nr:MAG: segregation/condensation protein A [Bdellovibrionota bacterium]
METSSLYSSSHPFAIELEFFDGPIDLLLHLVKRNELPIEKVSLAQVASQYLACIEQFRQLDLDIAGEYLVIAATLLSIKSSVLLNEPVQLEIDDQGNIIDPHAELLRKLKEAAVYKDGAAILGSRHLLDFDVFAPPSKLAGVEPPPVRLRPHDPMLLGIAFRKLVERVQETGVLEISFDSVSIVDRMMKVLDELKAADSPLSFAELVPDVQSKGSLIATFVALLELCKRGAIVVTQGDIFDEILIALSGQQFETTGLQSEFDAPPEDEVDTKSAVNE